MSHKKPLMTFALNDYDAVVSVEQVDRGAACGCFCAACGEPLVAKQGTQKIWHFAHMSGADCAHGVETALHKAAKQILFEKRELVVPSITVQATAVGKYSGRTYSAEASRPETFERFDYVALEQPIGQIVPDAVCISNGTKTLAEIAVTHFVDTNKAALIKQLGFPAIEIAIVQELYEQWNWERLYDEVIRSTVSKSWIYSTDYADLLARAMQSAIDFAQMENAPTERLVATPLNRNTAPLTRLSYRGKPIRLTEYPFGLVAWSPYDPEINNILKRFGGRWQPRYKNWLLSIQVKDMLMQAFY